MSSIRLKEVSLLFLVSAFCVVLISGCGSAADTLLDNGVSFNGDGEITIQDDEDGGTITIGEEGVAFESDDEDMSWEYGQSTSLPDGYPEDLVPLADDAVIATASTMERDGKQTFHISYGSSIEPGELFEFYQDVMEGSKNLFTSAAGNMYSVNGMKETRNISILITEAGEKNTVTITID